MNTIIAAFSSIRLTARVAFAATLTVALLTASSASAQVPTGTVDINGPAAVAAGQGVVYTVNYTLSGSDVTSSIVNVVMPIGFYYNSNVAPNGVVANCTNTVATGPTCAFDLNFTSGGVSGQLTISGYLSVGYQPDGATMTANASLDVGYDDTNGNPQTFTETDAQDTLVSADANPTVTTHDVVNVRWLVNPNPEVGKSDVGLSWQYRIRAVNYGNAYLEPGWTITNDIDDALTFVDWELLGTAGYTADTVPTAWAKADQINDLVLSNSQTLSGGLREVLVRVWVSCSDLPLVAGSLTNQLDLAGDEEKVGGLSPHTASHTSTLMPPTAEGACGTGGTAGKSSSPQTSVGEGEGVTWYLSLIPPNGAVVVDNAVIVDRIPADTTFVSASAGAPTEFTLYYCVVPAETGNFTAAQFLSNYQSNGCSTTAPGDPSTVTHVVWSAPTWGDPLVGIDNFSGSIATTIPIGVFADQDVVTNTARAEGEYPFNNGTNTFLFEPTDTVAVRTLAAGEVTSSQNPFGDNQQPRVGGEELIVYAWVGSLRGYARIRNPTVTMTLPPELEFIETLAPNFNGGCSWDGPLPTVYSDPATSQTLGDGSTELTWTFGSVAEPTLMGFECGNYVGSKPLWLPVRVRVDPFAGLINGQTLTYTSTVNSPNMVAPAQGSRNVVIAVPAEMRTDVQPDCSEDAEPLPSLLVRYENTGGEELSNVVVTVAVPKVGDGSGTEVDTTFVRTENVPAAGSIEYEVSAAWQSSPPGDLSTVTRVRLLQTTLGTLTGPQTFNVVISVPPGTPTGTFIRGSSLMAGDPLTQIASANSAPIKVNLCPGILAVHVYFDANNNGSQDPGEPDLPGWDIVTTDEGDASVVLNWTTDANGDYSQQLSPATYQMTVTHPTAGAGATWTSSPVSATVITNQTVSTEIPVTCSCTSDDVCITATCNEFGECVETVSDPLPDVADPCDGIDNDCDNETDEDFVPSDSSCGFGECAATGTTACVAGVEEDDCTPGIADDGPDLCDGLDTDCDDLVDEDFVAEATTCGVGVCEDTGMTSCVDGVVLDDCVEGDPTPGGEQCNGLDDDCNGQVDVTIGNINICNPVGTGIPITDTTGVLCGQYALNAENGYVSSGYTNVNQQFRFCYQYNGVTVSTPEPDLLQCGGAGGGGAMCTVSDDFNQADGPLDPGTWSFAGQPNLAIRSNQACGNGTDVGGAFTPACTESPSAVQVSVSFVALAGGNDETGVAASDAAFTGMVDVHVEVYDGPSGVGPYLQINQAGNLLAESPLLSITEGATYHIVGTFDGTDITGKLFLASDLVTPIASLTATALTTITYDVGLMASAGCMDDFQFSTLP